MLVALCSFPAIPFLARRPMASAPPTQLAKRQDVLADLMREFVADDWSPRISGHCMSPELSAGDRVRLERCRWPLPGDVVVVLEDDGRLLIHRLLGYWWRQGVAVLTRADATQSLDPVVGRRRLIGRLVEVEGQEFSVSSRLRWAMLGSLAGRASLAVARRVATLPSRGWLATAGGP